MKLYFEVCGALGKSKTAPLLLIRGAFPSTGSMKPWVAAFAAKRPVIVFDQFSTDFSLTSTPGWMPLSSDAMRAAEVPSPVGLPGSRTSFRVLRNSNSL